ncbi:MAG: hypothetical protein ACPLRH_05300 [Desulfotomaculales bacterium]
MRRSRAESPMVSRQTCCKTSLTVEGFLARAYRHLKHDKKANPRFGAGD